MSLVLHIGTHKTGTTTIQRFADRFRGELAGRGLLYPDYRSIGGPRHYAHHEVAHALSHGPRRRMTRAGARAFFRSLSARRGEHAHVLVSAEPFYRHLHGGGDERSEDYWARRARYVSGVRDAIGDLETTVLLVVRRQDHFARALFQESVRNAHYREPFERFLVDKAPLFAYLPQVRVWAEHFEVRVVVFEDLVDAREGLVPAFFGLLGTSIRGLDARQRHNGSLPADLIELKRLLNVADVPRERLERISTWLGDPHLLRAVPAERRAMEWASADDRAAFLDSFAEDNEVLRREHTALERDRLFPDPVVADAPTHEGLPPELFELLSAGLNELESRHGGAHR